MSNKKVNTSIDSNAIETTGQKVVRTVADKILTVVLVICTLAFLLSIATFVSEFKSNDSYVKPREASQMLSELKYSRASVIVMDVEKAKAVGQQATGDYALPYAIADYQRAALLAYAYTNIGDTAKAAYYEGLKEQSRSEMKEPASGSPLTIYADNIDKNIEEFLGQ